MRKTPAQWTWIGVRTVLFIAAIAYLLQWIDIALITTLFSSASWSLLFAAALAVVLSHLLRSIRLREIVHAIGQSVSFNKAFAVFSISAFWGRITPGKLGDMGKLGYFADKKKLFPYLVLERILDTGAAVLIAAPLAYLLHPILPWVVLFALISVGLLSLSRRFLRLIKRLLGKVLVLPKSSGAFMLRLSILTLLGWIASTSALYLVAIALGYTFSLPIFFGIAIAAVVVGILSGLPGGFGTREATLAYLLYILTGTPIEEGTAIALSAIVVVTLSEFVLFLFGNALDASSE